MAGAPPVASLIYKGGPLISSVNIISVFWGDWWNKPSGVDLRSELNNFLTYIADSPLMDELAEYSTAEYRIGRGRHSTSIVISDTSVNTVSDDALQKMLAENVGNGTLPKENPSNLYVTFLPSGETITKDGGASCSTFCGYHDSVDFKIFYAVIAYPDCAGCLGGLNPFDAITSVCTHEICEAITDPIPGNGWYDNNFGEIGDICAWKTKKIGKYTVQLEWSNKQNSCM